MFIIKGRQEMRVWKLDFAAIFAVKRVQLTIYPPSRRGHGFHAGKLRVSQLKLPLKSFQVDLPRVRQDFSHLNVLLDPLVTSLPVAFCSHVCRCVDAPVGGGSWLKLLPFIKVRQRLHDWSKCFSGSYYCSFIEGCFVLFLHLLNKVLSVAGRFHELNVVWMKRRMHPPFSPCTLSCQVWWEIKSPPPLWEGKIASSLNNSFIACS